MIRLMDKILHDLKDSKLRELRYIPYYGKCRILTINSMVHSSSLQLIMREPCGRRLRGAEIQGSGSEAGTEVAAWV